MSARTLDEHKARRIAFCFVLFLFAFEVYVVGVGYSEYFAYLLTTETYFFAAVAIICFGLAIYLCFGVIKAVLLARWGWRIVSVAIFALAVTVEYGYVKALGRFTDKADIETAIATTTEQQAASILMYLSLAAVVPCLVLLILLVAFKAEKPRELRHLVLSAALLVAAFALFPFIVDQKFPTLAIGAFVRTSVDFLVNGPVATGKWGSELTGVDVRRRTIQKPPLAEGRIPLNNIVIVVDESIRGDHFSLNGYGRDTTPVLDELASRGILYNWGIAAAASTGSRFTYAALITGLTPDDFPDRSEFKVNTFPTIFQYAKAMNYKTYFLDGQMNGYWGGVADDKNYFDNWQGILDISEHRSFNTWEVDDLIAKKVRSIIYESTGNFIFVFKRGAHIPYHTNFPPDDAKWAPIYQSENKFDIPSGERLTEVRNTYDNSIRYNVNSFFRNMVDDYAAIPNDSVILYTGDHGQTLFVNGRSSHGGDTKPEATVPLFIIGRFEGKPDTSYRASHQNIFPTVLDLIGYPEELRPHIAAPSLLEAKAADSRPRYFNPDLGHKIPFD